MDFANEADDIKAGFQPYYEITTLEENTDPNLLYDQKNRIEAAQVIWQSEIDNFAKVFFDPEFKTANQAKLNAFLDPAVERFKALPEDATVEGQISQDDLKHTMIAFTPFQDIELEKLFPYIRFLLKKLPKKSVEERLKLDDEVALEYYRINKTGEGNLELRENVEGTLFGPVEAGVRRKKDDQKSPLSEIITIVNDRFGTDFTETDRLFFDQIVEDCVADENLKIQARANTIDNFKFPFTDAFNNKVIDRMDLNTEIFNKLMDGGDFVNLASDLILQEVYHRLTASGG